MPISLLMKAAQYQLFQTESLDLQYPELLKLCTNITLNISEDHINTVEINSRTQANGLGCFRNCASRIGASFSSALFHTNLAQPSQSLIRTICYPSLYQVKTKENKTWSRARKWCHKGIWSSCQSKPFKLIGKEVWIIHKPRESISSCHTWFPRVL